MFSGSRPVAKIRRPGQARSSVSARDAQLTTRCSQLSSTTRSDFERRKLTSASVNVWPGRSGTLRIDATAWGTRAGSESAERSTNHTPSSNFSSRVAATWRASRVLPQPPEPVSVRSRVVGRRRVISAISCSRPMKLVN
jgi:hypothetical protein